MGLSIKRRYNARLKLYHRKRQELELLEMYTRKNFKQIATLMHYYTTAAKKENDDGTLYLLSKMARQFCDMFEQDNPRFRKEQFLDACGVPAND